MKNGLLVEVYRNAHGSSSNGGVTSKYQSFVLYEEGKNLGPFEPREGLPALRVVRRNIGGQPYLHAVPESPEGAEKMCGPMFGGCFVYTSDSRFPNDYPIPVHDRWETPEMNEVLSR